MVKPGVLYVVMVLVFVGSLWGILKLGADLQPPTNLAGTWTLEAINDTMDGSDVLAIAQSGRFVKLHRAGYPPVSMHWRGERMVGSQDKVILLEGDGQKLTVHPLGSAQDQAESPVYEFRFEGGMGGVWRATRQDEPSDPAS